MLLNGLPRAQIARTLLLDNGGRRLAAIDDVDRGVSAVPAERQKLIIVRLVSDRAGRARPMIITHYTFSQIEWARETQVIV